MELLFDYTLRLLPGLVLIGLLVALIPKEFILFRVVVLVMGFILMRDAMTPAGLWEFGITENTMWLRFIDSGFILLVLAVTSLEEVVFRNMFQEHMHKFVKPLHAIVLSGLLFAVGHTFLAITVTDLGFLVLLFTLWKV